MICTNPASSEPPPQELGDVGRLREVDVALVELRGVGPPCALLGPLAVGSCGVLRLEPHDGDRPSIVGDAGRDPQEARGSGPHLCLPPLALALQALGVRRPSLDHLYEHPDPPTAAEPLPPSMRLLARRRAMVGARLAGSRETAWHDRGDRARGHGAARRVAPVGRPRRDRWRAGACVRGRRRTPRSSTPTGSSWRPGYVDLQCNGGLGIDLAGCARAALGARRRAAPVRGDGVAAHHRHHTGRRRRSSDRGAGGGSTGRLAGSGAPRPSPGGAVPVAGEAGCPPRSPAATADAGRDRGMVARAAASRSSPSRPTCPVPSR